MRQRADHDLSSKKRLRLITNDLHAVTAGPLNHSQLPHPDDYCNHIFYYIVLFCCLGLGSGSALGVYVLISTAARVHSGPAIALSALIVGLSTWIVGQLKVVMTFAEQLVAL